LITITDLHICWEVRRLEAERLRILEKWNRQIEIAFRTPRISAGCKTVDKSDNKKLADFFL